jgi:hypothetical protein
MSDGVTLPGTGEPIDTKQLANGRHVQIARFDGGIGDTPMPIEALTSIPDNQVAAFPFRPVGQDIWNASFSASGASVLDDQFAAPTVGTGITYSQAAGALSIVAGTSTNAEFLARSIRSWRGSLRLRFAATLSQRIANNNFAVLLADLLGASLAYTINSATSVTVTLPGHELTAQNVGQFVNLGAITGAAGVPGRYAIASVVAGVSITFTVAGWPASGSGTLTLFGHSYIRNVFNGTGATTMNFDAQRRGWASGDTAATINTTASPGVVVQNDVNGREIFCSDSLRASSTAPNFVARASRFENLPDDNLPLHLFIWSFNGTAAPASSTTLTLSFASVEKICNFPVFVQGFRGQGNINAPSVTVANTVPVTLATNTPTLAAGTNLAADFGLQYRGNATGAASSLKVIAGPSTNATIVKAAAGRVIGWSLGNTSSGWRYVKLHNIATLPVAGTGVARVIAIPPGGLAQNAFDGGIGFATGIGMTIVTGSADADATAVALGDVVGELVFA